MSLESSFKGKRVLVTGGARGIGKALVSQLVEYGASVIAVSKNPDNLAKLKAELPNITTIAVDLQDWNGTREALKSVQPVDYLINNAGVLEFEDFFSITQDSVDKTFDTNVKSVINVSQIVAQGMIAAGNGGSILNMSSSASKKAGPGFATYCASKAALDMLTKSMAIELGRHKIRVNSINPAGVGTELLLPVMEKMFKAAGVEPAVLQEQLLARIPLGKPLVEMSDVVNLALFVLSEKASMLHGENIVMDGGYTLT